MGNRGTYGYISGKMKEGVPWEFRKWRIEYVLVGARREDRWVDESVGWCDKDARTDNPVAKSTKTTSGCGPDGRTWARVRHVTRRAEGRDVGSGLGGQIRFGRR